MYWALLWVSVCRTKAFLWLKVIEHCGHFSSLLGIMLVSFLKDDSARGTSAVTLSHSAAAAVLEN